MATSFNDSLFGDVGRFANMNRLEFLTKSQAQAKCDAIHAWMISNNAEYAASVEAGQTVKWADPMQDVDDEGNAIGTKWYVPVSARCEGAY